MLIWLLRACFIAILLTLTTLTVTFFNAQDVQAPLGFVVVSAILLTIGGIVFLIDIWDKKKQITTFSSLYFGLFLGLLLGWLLSSALRPILTSLMTGTTEQIETLSMIWQIGITSICCYLTISTLLQTRDDFRFIIPYVEFSKQVKGNRPMVLDTSVIIDGRIADLCDTRIVDAQLIVPRFVMQELQGIADSSDKLKRNRGRRGLDILKRLQANTNVDLQIETTSGNEQRTGERIRVDERLVIYAKEIDGRVVTNDFNLNKIAQLQGVTVINLNEVANSLKTVALPGEPMMVRVVKPGDQIGQGVGYLDDGTMVVVEQGRPLIGQESSIIVTSVLQTPAGRMIFGRPDTRTSSGTYMPVSGPKSGEHVPVSGGGSPSSQHDAFREPDTK